MPKTTNNDIELEIRNFVEQIFLTSSTDEQVKLRLVKNIKAWAAKQAEEARLSELLNIPFNDGWFDNKWIEKHWAARIKKLEAELRGDT